MIEFRAPARRFFLPLLLVAFASIPLAAQPQAGERPARRNIFRDTQEVRVVNVDVVVTDADGRPVTGLAREDFELVENGEPVAVSNFFAVAGGELVTLVSAGLEGEEARGEEPAAPAAVAEPLHLVVLVDNANITPANRDRVLQRLQDLFADPWRPGTRVMVATRGRRGEVRQGFTSDPAELAGTLAEIRKESSENSRLEAERRALIRAIETVNVEAGSRLFATKAGAGAAPSPSQPGGDGNADVSQEELTARTAMEAQSLLPQIVAYAEARMMEVGATLGHLERFVDTIAGLPGKKALMYVSDGLSLKPAEALLEAYERRFSQLPGALSGSYSPRGEAGRLDATAGFVDLVARANAGRVTFYTVDASPPAATERGSAAGRGTAGGNFGLWDSSVAAVEERNEQESLVILAEGTGGRAALTSTTLEAAFKSFRDDLENYYSLGYVVTDEVPAGERRLEVRLAGGAQRRGLTVRHRRSVRDKTPDERMAERTYTALWTEDLANPLGIAVETREEDRQKDGNFMVPVVVKVPLGKLVLLPKERNHEAQVALFVAVLDEAGRSSEVVKHLCPIRIPNAELLVALGQEAICGVRLLMRPGRQQVAVGVRDELAAVGSTARLTVEVGANRG